MFFFRKLLLCQGSPQQNSGADVTLLRPPRTRGGRFSPRRVAQNFNLKVVVKFARKFALALTTPPAHHGFQFLHLCEEAFHSLCCTEKHTIMSSSQARSRRFPQHLTTHRCFQVAPAATRTAILIQEIVSPPSLSSPSTTPKLILQ